MMAIGKKDFLNSLRETLYKENKFATPAILYQRAQIAPSEKERQRYIRMRERRKPLWDWYKMMCEEIDDEGDCNK